MLPADLEGRMQSNKNPNRCKFLSYINIAKPAGGGGLLGEQWKKENHDGTTGGFGVGHY